MSRILHMTVEQLAEYQARHGGQRKVAKGSPVTGTTTTAPPADDSRRRRAAKSAAGPHRRRADVSATRPLERDVLAAVLAALRAHPRVAFAWRANAGSFEVNGRRIRAGNRCDSRTSRSGSSGNFTGA